MDSQFKLPSHLFAQGFGFRRLTDKECWQIWGLSNWILGSVKYAGVRDLCPVQIIDAVLSMVRSTQPSPVEQSSAHTISSQVPLHDRASYYIPSL